MKNNDETKGKIIQFPRQKVQAETTSPAGKMHDLSRRREVKEARPGIFATLISITKLLRYLAEDALNESASVGDVLRYIQLIEDLTRAFKRKLST